MKAIGYNKPVSDTGENFFEFETNTPKPTDHDLLVKVNATSVNPVDVGVRNGLDRSLEKPKVIGWDAVGVVESVGASVTMFKPGDRVFYAGSFIRPGSDSEYQLIDERIVGNAPKTLTDAEAAAMPLTSLAAWEAMFEQLEINPNNYAENQKHTILIINGAGGVGSIATQLAKWAGLHVIATAGRPETIQWVKDHGADDVINHHYNLADELNKLGYKYVDYILGLKGIDSYWQLMTEIIKPFGRIASITENQAGIDLQQLTKKSGHFAWEWMFSKSYYHENMISQHNILNKVAELLDNGTIKSTLTKELTPINAANLEQAHELVASGKMIGKVVLTNK